MSQKFEVQENTVCDGWMNNWSWSDENNVDHAQTFESHDDALAAIYEFFADLSRAHMAQSYDMEDYRVVPVQQPDGVPYK